MRSSWRRASGASEAARDASRLTVAVLCVAFIHGVLPFAGKFAQLHPPRSGHDPFRRRFVTYVANNAEARARLDDIVARFVAKRLKAATGNRWDHFAFQSEPSFRVHLAGARTLGIR